MMLVEIRGGERDVDGHVLRFRGRECDLQIRLPRWNGHRDYDRGRGIALDQLYWMLVQHFQQRGLI